MFSSHLNPYTGKFYGIAHPCKLYLLNYARSEESLFELKVLTYLLLPWNI